MKKRDAADMIVIIIISLFSWEIIFYSLHDLANGNPLQHLPSALILVVLLLGSLGFITLTKERVRPVISITVLNVCMNIFLSMAVNDLWFDQVYTWLAIAILLGGYLLFAMMIRLFVTTFFEQFKGWGRVGLLSLQWLTSAAIILMWFACFVPQGTVL
ncbi:MAG: hypothetical protein ACKKL5_03370 [Candidatus Komeilibacteria bacterium]